MTFSNTETRELFIDTLVNLVEQNPQDPLAFARHWTEVAGEGSVVEQLARQLRKDLVNEWGRPGEIPQDPMLPLMRSGLRRVKFREIAEQLVRFCQPAEARAEKDFDDLGYGDSDLV